MKLRAYGFGITVALSCLLCVPAMAQAPTSLDPSAESIATTRPTPRASDGRPDLSGLWSGTGGSQPVAFRSEKTADGSLKFGVSPDPKTVAIFKNSFLPTQNPPQYKPEAQARLKKIQSGNLNRQDNVFVCGHAGLPRVGAPGQIIQTPGQVVFLYSDLSGMVFRVIPTDGSAPRDTEPSFFGVGVGRWDGDTLVVDTGNFVTDTWIGEEGFFHSDQMRVTERFRRVGDTIQYDVTVDDPGVLAQPWVKPMQMLTKTNAPLEEPYPCDPQRAAQSFDGGRHDQRGK